MKRIIIDDSRMDENPPKLIITIKRNMKTVRCYVLNFVNDKVNIIKIK